LFLFSSCFCLTNLSFSFCCFLLEFLIQTYISFACELMLRIKFQWST
jgi:hypothetical protein